MNDPPTVPKTEIESEVLAKDARRAREKETLLANVADARLNTLQTRVAWLLNHLPETRESDITLQLRYWKYFDDERYKGGPIYPDDLYRLTRLTSLARARATIQNTHGLFLGSEEVRKRRGTLQEEEREAARETSAAATKSFSVYADESGKTSDNLVVGSVWLLNGIESRTIVRAIETWRQAEKFTSELHFAELSRGTLKKYRDALQLLHSHSAALSLKAIVLPRRGLRDVDAALNDMFYHLIVRGIEHEQRNGRATLPRVLQLWKDAENEASDKLMLANLSDKLRQAANSLFDKNLSVGEMFAHDSKSNVFLQFADLFVSSINRKLSNPGSDGTHPKDAFATELLRTFGVREISDTLDSVGDVIVFEDV